MRIEIAGEEHLGGWAELRAALWPDTSIEEHESELMTLLAARNDRSAAFVALDRERHVVGFAEASLRHDYVNGCDTTPVTFLEGIYVRPEQRRGGIARLLCTSIEAWGRRAGCYEMASDADVANIESHAFHAAAGFDERERVVFFRKLL